MHGCDLSSKVHPQLQLNKTKVINSQLQFLLIYESLLVIEIHDITYFLFAQIK